MRSRLGEDGKCVAEVSIAIEFVELLRASDWHGDEVQTTHEGLPATKSTYPIGDFFRPSLPQLEL